MVNTFITSRRQKEGTGKYIPDYRGSAKNLDLQRLRKQCVEAHQILNILTQLHRIAELEKWDPCIPVSLSETTLSVHDQTSRYLSRVKWVKETRKKYLELPYRYSVIAGKTYQFPKNELPCRIRPTEKWSFSSDGMVETQTRKYCRNKVVLPVDSIYTLGFSQHAIVKMWIGYEDSLREYINAHIAEYCSRKTKSGNRCSISLDTFDINGKTYPHPWWITEYDGVILSHRASLLRKENTRKEDEWYGKIKEFISTPREWLETGYVWPGSFDEKHAHQLISDILSGKYIHPQFVTAPISADQRPLKTQTQLRKKFRYNGRYLLDQDGYVKICLVR